MSASKSTLSVFLLVCFLFCSVSEDLKITAHPGDDVTLPCQAPNNVTITVVKWTRSDLKKRVFLKTDGHVETADQDPSFLKRVQLKDDEMKNGELSLILKNVNNNDEGTYVCSYKEETATKIKPSSIVYLKVEDQQIKEIAVRPGDDVTLSCEAPNVTITTVEWIRSDLKRHVYMKSDENLNTTDQDPSYVNRVQLEDDEMKNGDLSLILKNVNNNDEGTYVCRYVEDGGRRKKRADQIKLISIVYLKVAGPTGGDSEDGKDKHGFIVSVTVNVALIACVFSLGFMIFKKCRGRSENNSDLPVDDPDVL